MKQLKNIYQALAPGGSYLCFTPNRLSGPHDISKYFDEVATGFHLREYTNTELVAIFKKTGFSEIMVYMGFKGYLGIRLTPVIATCIVCAHERRLPQIFNGIRGTFCKRRGVPCISM